MMRRQNTCNHANPGTATLFSSQCRAGKAGWLLTRVMLCCVIGLFVQHRKSENVSKRVRKEAWRRMIHRLRQTEGLAESLAAEVNILTSSHMRARTRCTHCTGLYLDDKWQYNYTPHRPFTLLSGSGLKTKHFKVAKNKRPKSASQHS